MRLPADLASDEAQTLCFLRGEPTCNLDHPREPAVMALSILLCAVSS